MGGVISDFENSSLKKLLSSSDFIIISSRDFIGRVILMNDHFGCQWSGSKNSQREKAGQKYFVEKLAKSSEYFH